MVTRAKIIFLALRQEPNRRPRSHQRDVGRDRGGSGVYDVQISRIFSIFLAKISTSATCAFRMSTQILSDEQNEQDFAWYLAVFRSTRYSLGPHTTFKSRSRSISLCQSPRSSRTPISIVTTRACLPSRDPQRHAAYRGHAIWWARLDRDKETARRQAAALTRQHDQLIRAFRSPAIRALGLLLLSPRRSDSSRSTS